MGECPGGREGVCCFIFLIFILLAVLGLFAVSGFSLVAVTRGYSPVAVRGLLTVVASVVVEHRL